MTRGACYWFTCSGNVVAAYAVIQGLWGLVACRAIVRYGASALALTLWPRLNHASYHVLRWPLLALVYTIVLVEFSLYLALRVAVSGLEAAVATPSHRALRATLSHAPDYASWLATARALDASRGAALWQADLQSTRYNWPFVKGLVTRLRTARMVGDWRAVEAALRLCSRPNVGGVMAPQLFSATHTGAPKAVVADFVDEVAASVRWLATRAACGPEHLACAARTRALITDAHTAYGRTVLSLSGGGALGTYHFGVLRALVETNLLPDAVCGTSAGAIVAAFACCRSKAELSSVLFDDMELVARLRCFEKRPWEMAAAWWRTGQCYSNARWMEIARWFANDGTPAGVRDMTFLEAFERSGRRLAVTACARGKRAPPVLLTHATSPHVTIVSAVVATAGVPGLVSAQVLLEKDPETGMVRPQPGGEAYRDGSIVHDVPVAALRDAFDARGTGPSFGAEQKRL